MTTRSQPRCRKALAPRSTQGPLSRPNLRPNGNQFLRPKPDGNKSIQNSYLIYRLLDVYPPKSKIYPPSLPPSSSLPKPAGGGSRRGVLILVAVAFAVSVMVFAGIRFYRHKARTTPPAVRQVSLTTVRRKNQNSLRDSRSSTGHEFEVVFQEGPLGMAFGQTAHVFARDQSNRGI